MIVTTWLVYTQPVESVAFACLHVWLVGRNTHAYKDMRTYVHTHTHTHTLSLSLSFFLSLLLVSHHKHATTHDWGCRLQERQRVAKAGHRLIQLHIHIANVRVKRGKRSHSIGVILNPSANVHHASRRHRAGAVVVNSGAFIQHVGNGQSTRINSHHPLNSLLQKRARKQITKERHQKTTATKRGQGVE